MLEKLTLIIGLILSISATVISIVTLMHNKRELYVSSISQSRIKYMEELTEHLSSFIEAYINDDKKLAKIIKYRIELYFNPNNPEHIKESRLLNMCINTHFSDENLMNLVKQTQILLTNIYEQIKFESYNKSMSEKMRLHYYDY